MAHSPYSQNGKEGTSTISIHVFFFSLINYLKILSYDNIVIFYNRVVLLLWSLLTRLKISLGIL